jgi:hypothetical protein
MTCPFRTPEKISSNDCDCGSVCDETTGNRIESNVVIAHEALVSILASLEKVGLK